MDNKFTLTVNVEWVMEGCPVGMNIKKTFAAKDVTDVWPFLADVSVLIGKTVLGGGEPSKPGSGQRTLT